MQTRMHSSNLQLAKGGLHPLPCVVRPKQLVPRVQRSLVTAAAYGKANRSSMDSEERQRPFPYAMPMDPQQKTLSSIPLALLYPAFVAAIGGVGFVGSLAGRALPVDPGSKQLVSYALAAVSAAATAAACVQAKKTRDTAAVVDLYNAIVDLPDPCNLTPQIVNGVGAKYGISMQRDDIDGLKRIYSQFLESIIPSGDVQLTGDEADKLIAFKAALGLTDEDAAPVHIEVARRLFRQGYEAKDRHTQFEQRKAFQRLIYVSQIVFGDQKSAFLLPWRRHFSLTDAQLFVARRDNAKAIFKAFMDQRGGELSSERHFLHELREYQQKIKMMDETAEEVVREYARKHVEARLAKAVEAAKAAGKARDVAFILSELSHVAEYSRKLARCANEEDLIPGLGPVTLAGSPMLADGKARDVRELYKVFLEEHMSREGTLTPALEADARDLQTILCISAKDAQYFQDEMAAKLYKKLLRDEVASKRLDAAESPAKVLQAMCERVKFSPEAAMEMHRGLYKQKLVSLVNEKKKLDDEDVEELKRIRRILCIQDDVAKKVQRDTIGRLLHQVISDIFAGGAKPLSESESQRVDEAINHLRIEQDISMEVLTQAVRDQFRSFLQQVQREREKEPATAAATIKKLIQFNVLVVTPLLDKVKGVDVAKKELADILAKAVEEAKQEEAAEAAGAESAPAVDAASATIDVEASDAKDAAVKAVQKAMKASRGELDEDEERKGQREITLRDVMDPRHRADFYKFFLVQSMSGDNKTDLPMGGALHKKANAESQHSQLVRLQALADLLGMNQMEIASVHSSLADQAFRTQATEILKSGPMSEEKTQQLEELRAQLGMAKESADKIIKAVKVEVYGSAAVAADEGVKWTLDRALEVHKSGGNVADMAEEVTRRNMFRREFERRVSDGSGNFDAEYMLRTLPLDVLGLEERKVRMVAKELVGTRKRMLLVQAVSTYRQRRTHDTLVSLQNLVNCSRALPDDKPMSWNSKAELAQVYGLYCQKEASDAKRNELQKILGLSDSDAAEAKHSVAVKGSGGAGGGHDDEFF